jgi:hypothetical protein
VVPKIKGYRIRQEVLVLDNGAQSHKLVKVPVGELAQWDAKHDALGHTYGAHSDDRSDGKHDHTVGGKA